MEKTINKNADKSVKSVVIPAAPVPSADGKTAESAVSYPEQITATINLLKLYEYDETDADGNKILDDKTNEPIKHRQCTLMLDNTIDGVVIEKSGTTDKFVLGKTNKIGYSAYYLLEVAKLSNKRLRVFCTRMVDKHKLHKFSRAAMQALFEDAEIVVNRKFHKAGDIYITGNGEAKTYQADGFAKDILDINIPAENIEMFKEEVLADIE